MGIMTGHLAQVTRIHAVEADGIHMAEVAEAISVMPNQSLPERSMEMIISWLNIHSKNINSMC